MAVSCLEIVFKSQIFLNPGFFFGQPMFKYTCKFVFDLLLNITSYVIAVSLDCNIS